MNPHWPLFDLRMTTDALTLRPMRESDLASVVATLPADVDQDPAATRFRPDEPELDRGSIVMQHYWRSLGTWSIDAWRLTFVAFTEDGSLIGLQELEGNHFPKFRTVDSSSHVNTGLRGRGFGRQMRDAVLTLAFDHLGALAAVSSAYHDNLASLAVSRALGYTPNGESFEARGDGIDVLQHMRITKEQWADSEGGKNVTISGVDATLPFFGLATPPSPS